MTKIRKAKTSLKYFSLKSLIIKLFLISCFVLIFTNSVFPQSVDPKLLELRKQLAVEYLHPESHFALALYYLNKGDKLQAFLIMEYARRNRFSQENFNAAFKKYFGDNSPEPNEEIKKNFKRAYELLEQKKTDEAEKALITVAKLAPKSSVIQVWTGRFFYKVRQNNEQALKYYFDAYFLNPDAYETEYAESRIRNISFDKAKSEFDKLVRNGKTLSEIAKNENPLIAGTAIEQMAKNWKPAYRESVIYCLENDTDEIRWLAFDTLFKNSGSLSGKFINELLKDDDLRKRGLAAYGLIGLQKEKSFDVLKKMLADEAELIRFDAASALAMQGGRAGLEILRQHRKVETNTLLKEIIDKTLNGK